MACRGRGGSIFLLCFGFLAFVTSLCHCTSLTRLKALDETREASVHTESQAKKTQQYHGRLLIGQNLQNSKFSITNSTETVLDDESDYQADMDWWQAKQDHGSKPDIEAIEQLLKMDPRVECTGDSMKLLVQDAASTPASLLFVDRGHLSPLSLSKLPLSCGYNIRSTRRDLVLIAPYTGCFVIIEDGSYVLPLRWWGLPVRVSCPLTRHLMSSPPMVTCHVEGMVVKTDWAASKIKVNVDGNWEPLLRATNRCMFSIVEHPEGVVISIRYAPCLAKKDGLYTLELGGAGETKISCPSMTAQPEPTKPEGPSQQSGTESGWMYTSSAHATSAHPPQTGPQFQGLPPKSQIPNEPNRGPQRIDRPPFPYYPLFPSFLSPHLTSPDTEAQPPKPTSPITQLGKRQSLHPFPFYSQGPVYAIPTMESLGTKSPQGKHEDISYQSPFNVTAGFNQKPLGPLPSQSRIVKPGQGQKPRHPFLYPQRLVSQAPHLHPLYHKLPKKPSPSHPTVSVKPQGELYQPYYLLYTQQNPNSKPTGVSQKPQRETLSQMYQPFYPVHLYNQTNPGAKPTDLGALQPGTPHGHRPSYPYSYNQTMPGTTPTGSKPQMPLDQMYHLLNPYYQGKPGTKPTDGSQPKQPQMPLDQMYHLLNPYYQGKPGTKPTDGSQPKQPQMPLDQMYHLLNPYYQGKPGTKPADGSQPKQPQMPFDQMYHLLNPYYQGKPGTKPTDGSKPKQPQMPHDQMYHLLNPHYQGKPGTKPTDGSKPKQPQMPHDQMYHLLNPYYVHQGKPGSKPTFSRPLQPEMSHGPMYHLFNPYIHGQRKPGSKPSVSRPPQPGTTQDHVQQPPQPQLKPGIPLVSNPTADPQSLQPEASQDQINQEICFSQMAAENQLANMPTGAPGTGTTQGQLYDLCRLFRIPGGGTNDGTPMAIPTHSAQSPNTKPQQVQMAYPYNLLYSQQPPAPHGQQEASSLAINKKLLDSTIQYMSNVGISSQGPQASSSLVQPLVCPQFCPYGFVNCCPQIAFHQHLHIAPVSDKDGPIFYPGLPFLSMVAFTDLSNGLDVASILQKLAEAATPQTEGTITSTQILPQSPPSLGEKSPDGNPTAQPGSSPSKTPNEQMVFPPFLGQSSYSYWPYVLNFDQSSPVAHSSDPSKYQTLGDAPSQPVRPYESFNTHLPNPQIGQLLTGSKPGEIPPDLMSYISQYAHVPEQPNYHAANDLQSLNGNLERTSLTHDSQHGIDQFFIPHYMPQDEPVPTRNDSQEKLESSLKNSSKSEQTPDSHSVPQSYVLLQYGPPGREPNSFKDSTMPLQDLVSGDSEMLNLMTQPSGDPQNVDPLQEMDQQQKWLEEGMFAPVPGDYMQRFDGLALPLSSLPSDDPQVYFPPENSFSAAHLKPEDPWKSLKPSDLSQRFPPHVPEEMLQRSSDQPANGLTQPLQTEQGSP